MKNFIFLVGTMNNSELGGPRPSWIDNILLPHLCIVCFITFLAIYQGKFVFGKFQKKLGLRSDPPPPCWAECPTFSENGFWGPPNQHIKGYTAVHWKEIKVHPFLQNPPGQGWFPYPSKSSAWRVNVALDHHLRVLPPPLAIKKPPGGVNTRWTEVSHATTKHANLH